jgi:cytochrome b pre-mRNA-processing protein 3
MAFLKRLLGLEPSLAAAQAADLLDWVVGISRAPGFFGAGRAADTFEGRLEVLMAHGAVLVARLRRDPSDRAVSQSFVDQFFRYLDASLREDGVGDLSVPKRMKRLAGAFYGRLQAYEAALAASDPQELVVALQRNAFGAEAGSYIPVFAAHLHAVASALQAADIAQIRALAFVAADPEA